MKGYVAKKIVSVGLVLMLLSAMLPMSVLAVEDEGGAESSQTDYSEPSGGEDASASSGGEDVSASSDEDDASSGGEDDSAPADSSTPAGREEQPSEPAGSEEQPSAPAGSEEQPSAPAGSEEQPSAPAGSEEQPSAPAGSGVTPAAPEEEGPKKGGRPDNEAAVAPGQTQDPASSAQLPADPAASSQTTPVNPQEVPGVLPEVPPVQPVPEVIAPVGISREIPDYTYTSDNEEVDGWDVSCDGENIIFNFSGVTDPDYRMFSCALNYGSTSAGDIQFVIYVNESKGAVKFDWGDAIDGAVSDVWGGEAGVYEAEFQIPLDFFQEPDFDLTFCGETVNAAEIPGYEAVAPALMSLRAESAHGAVVPGRITVDGNLEDWAGVTAYTCADPSRYLFAEWKIAQDEDGNLYFAATGTANTEWDMPDWYLISITQEGQNWNQPLGIAITNIGKETGAEVVINNQAQHNTAAPCNVELMIPARYFVDPNFIISVYGTDLTASDIELLDGQDVTPAYEPVYEGITIDGLYSDWDAVTKYPAPDARDGRPSYLDSAAMVFDGDMVYIYLKEAEHTNGGYNAGSHSNGQYAITTDLGNTLLVQLTYGGEVSGLDGAEAAHVGGQWEVSVPASQLPAYRESLSFGLYQQEPFIYDVTNLNGQGSGGSFVGIVYDGNYSDWDYYPHTLIEYDTAGTSHHVPDGEGALYADGSTLYGHVRTVHPDHLMEGGTELAYAITIRFNEDDSQVFYPRLISGSEANPDWSSVQSLPEGTYEFLLVDMNGWSNGADLVTGMGNRVYGRMFITVGEFKHECEFYLDLEKVAELLGCDATDFKVIQARFGRIGDEWITTAGASSGAYMGILICCAFAGGVLIWKKRKVGESA